MQIKVGTDLVAIERVKASLEKFGEKFLDRFLSPNEKAYAKRIESIAGYWAAKEAIAKALGCGIGRELSFLDIEIYKDDKRAPHFLIHSKNFKVINASLSISHDSGFAMAVAIVILD